MDDDVKGIDAYVSQNIVLKSSDNMSFELKTNSALISKLVAQSLDGGIILLLLLFILGGVDVHATEVPIPGAKGAILELIVQYMTHHEGKEPPIIEKPLRSKLMSDVCKVFFAVEFFFKKKKLDIGQVGCKLD